MVRRTGWLAVAAAVTLAACARDIAREEYMAALRGEETGMTREERGDPRPEGFDPARVVHDDVEARARTAAQKGRNRVGALGRIPAAPRQVDVEHLDRQPRERDRFVLGAHERGDGVEPLFARQARRWLEGRVNRW